MLDNVRYSVLASTWSPHYDRFLTNDGRHKPSPVELIGLAAEVNGLKGIELIHPAHVRPDNLSTIRDTLNQHGLQLASIAASISIAPEYWGGSLTSDDPSVRSRTTIAIRKPRKPESERLALNPNSPAAGRCRVPRR